MIEIRKIITTRETVFSELGLRVSRPGTGRCYGAGGEEMATSSLH